MIRKEDFVWKEHRVNNIDTNPIENIYCIIDVGESARRYSIQPQYPLHKEGYIDTINDKPELYILFEDIGRKATIEEKNNWICKSNLYDDYCFNGKGFIRAFKTLEEAKEQAYKQYIAIFGYALSHIVDDVEDATKKHFVIK